MRPKSINVLGVKYKIRYFKNLSNVNNSGDKDRCYGTVDFTKSEIRIYDNNNHEFMFQTLIHEIIHIFETAYGKAFEETEIELYASSIVSFLVLNKWLDKKLLK